ncbi:MAG: hypothetical protein PHS92_05335 [Candidatus Gracilibacteria bacterium]|nr:hypothetical protein [Candidatus Gracilibacteria bacterium]
MDWNKLKERAITFKDKAMDMKDKAVELAEKGKEYKQKAIDFGSDTINKTPMALKIMADYEKVKADKYLVILFLKKDEDESKKLLLQMPVIMSRGWINSATIRTCFINEAKEVSDGLEITNAPVILTYKSGELSKKLENIEEIKAFIKEFNI